MTDKPRHAGAPEMLSFDYAGERYLFPFDAAADIACRLSDFAEADVAPGYCAEVVPDILRVLVARGWRLYPPACEVRGADIGGERQ